MGLHDEIYQGGQPVLVGVDAGSTYCYLLAAAEFRDENTWGFHLLEAMEQGLNPEYTIADAAKGLRAGQKAAFGDTPCHGALFHIQQQCQSLTNVLCRQAAGATSLRQKLEQQMQQAKQQGRGNRLSTKLTLTRQAERQAIQFSRDVKTLIQWLSHDVLSLAGPPLADRQELFDFIVAELKLREVAGCQRIHPLRVALFQQRDDLLAFAQVLDQQLADIAQCFHTPDFSR